MIPLKNKRVLTSLAGLVVSLTVAACGGQGAVVAESTQPVATVPLVEVTPIPATAEEATPATTPTPSYDPFGDTRPLSEVGYVMPPTVQHVTETTAQLLFELEAPQPGLIFYRAREGGDLLALQLRPDSAYHSLLLEDLDPGQTYDLLVRLGGDPPESIVGAPYSVLLDMGGPGPEALSDVAFLGEAWGAQSFRTPPFGEPVRFAVIGDSGFGEDVTASLAQQIADFDPYFVLHTGDVVYKGEESGGALPAFQAKYYSPFAPVLRQAPLYPVVGNHDVVDNGVKLDGLPFYYRAFPPIVYPFSTPAQATGTRQFNAFGVTIGEAQVQFLQLDTQVLFGEQGRAEEQAWLEERLADPAYAYSIVSMHVPPYSSSRHNTDALAVRGWAQLFEDSGVPVVFTGHEHVFEHLRSGPTNYLLTGGGSASLYGLSSTDPRSQFFASRSHVTLVELFSDRIDIRVVSPSGEVIYTLTVPAPAP